MDFKVELSVDGRTLEPDEDAGEALQLQGRFNLAALETARERFRDVRCPVHGRQPENLAVVADPAGARVTLTTCCTQLQELADATTEVG